MYFIVFLGVCVLFFRIHRCYLLLLAKWSSIFRWVLVRFSCLRTAPTLMDYVLIATHKTKYFFLRFFVIVTKMAVKCSTICIYKYWFWSSFSWYTGTLLYCFCIPAFNYFLYKFVEKSICCHLVVPFPFLKWFDCLYIVDYTKYVTFHSKFQLKYEH